MLGTGHRRPVACSRTWQVGWAGTKLFVKANSDRAKAVQEIAGHERLRARYPVSALLGTWRIGRWTVLAYARWPHVGHDSGLLVDEISRAELRHDRARLDACLDGILGHYRNIIADTLQLTTFAHSASMRYCDRGADGWPAGIHGAGTPWLILESGSHLLPSELAATCLVVNGRPHWIDVSQLDAELRVQFAGCNPTWAALTQGDPTDRNIGWSADHGPVWFDYDGGGFNAIAGEFASFLLYQRLHGAWLVPTYAPAVFRDHPSALLASALNRPTVRLARDGRHGLLLDYAFRPSPVRQHVIRRYLRELVEPVATRLRIRDLMGWLRPYLVSELLGVLSTRRLSAADTALSLGLLADTLHPDTTVDQVLALTPTLAGAS